MSKKVSFPVGIVTQGVLDCTGLYGEMYTSGKVMF